MVLGRLVQLLGDCTHCYTGMFVIYCCGRADYIEQSLHILAREHRKFLKLLCCPGQCNSWNSKWKIKIIVGDGEKQNLKVKAVFVAERIELQSTPRHILLLFAKRQGSLQDDRRAMGDYRGRCSVEWRIQQRKSVHWLSSSEREVLGAQNQGEFADHMQIGVLRAGGCHILLPCCLWPELTVATGSSSSSFVHTAQGYLCPCWHSQAVKPLWFGQTLTQYLATKIRPICLPCLSCACSVLTRSGPQVIIPGYPGLSQFIWQYPWSTPDIKSYPVFRWTVELRRGVTRPAAAARQPGAEMNETYGMSTSEGI